MSTRVNVTIKSPQGTFLYEIPSSGDEPYNIEALKNWSGDLSELRDLCLNPGHVGNPSYYFDVDTMKGTFVFRKAQLYWVRAPKDWEERGWNCYKYRDYDSYGYHSTRRGTKIWTHYYPKIFDVFSSQPDIGYTREDMKSLYKVLNSGLNRYMAGLIKTHYKYDPDKVCTWLSAVEDFAEVFFGSIKTLPLHMDVQGLERDIVSWRLAENAGT